MATKKMESKKQKTTTKVLPLGHRKNGKNKHTAKHLALVDAGTAADDFDRGPTSVDVGAGAVAAPKRKGKRVNRASGEVGLSVAGGSMEGGFTESPATALAETTAETTPLAVVPNGKGKRAKGAATNERTTPTNGARTGRDPRLPAPGTILRKLDRHGALRCECIVEEDGVRYQETTYRSLSAAAVAAAKDLGINGAQNGYVFWGLVKPPRPTTENALLRLQKTWDRYATCARSALTTAAEEQKPELLAAIERHREVQLGAR